MNIEGMVKGIFAVTAIVMIAMFTFYGFVAYKAVEVINDPAKSAKEIGVIIKSIEEGYQEGNTDSTTFKNQ